MLLSTRLIFLVSVSFIVMFLSGCSAPPSTQNVAAPAPTNEPPAFPFSVTEPEVFQADIVVSGEGIERRMFVARDHGRYRIDFDTDAPGRRAVIRAETNYLISYKERIYAEEQPVNGVDASRDDDYTGLILDRRLHADFESVGVENGLDKYEAHIDGDDASVAVVYFDPAVKTVVKQELYRIAGDERRLVYSTEFRNVKLEAPAALFQPPDGFWRVEIGEFRKHTR